VILKVDYFNLSKVNKLALYFKSVETAYLGEIILNHEKSPFLSLNRVLLGYTRLIKNLIF